jgi:alpha-glucoside transport system permease protein
MSAPAIPVPEIDQARPATQAAADDEAPGAHRGGWFVRISVVIIVLLWLIPTLGVLFTSFRPENLVDTSGWWTALAHPFRAAEWTLDNYRLALDRGGLGNAFLNSLAVTIPSTVIPITIAAFAAYASRGWSSGDGTCCSSSSWGSWWCRSR